MSKRTKILISITMVIVVMCSVMLTACDDEQDRFSDMYVNESGLGEITSYEEYTKIPKGWQIRANSEIGDKPTDLGYIDSINAFVLERTTNRNILSLYMVDSNKLLFEESTHVEGMRVRGDLVACKVPNGAFVYNLKKNNMAISPLKFKNVTDNLSIDNILKILDNQTVAILPKYDASNKGDTNLEYTSIYRPTYVGNTNHGKLIARIKNINGSLGTLLAFDGKYAQITGDKRSSTESAETTRIYNLVKHEPEYLNNGDKVIVKSSSTHYANDVTYIGNGRFYCYEEWEVNDAKEMDFEINNIKYKTNRFIYNADVLKEFPYKSDKIIAQITNKYYGVTKKLINSASFLNGDLMYAPKCYVVTKDKKAMYDQFILDTDLNVKASLSGNFGITMKTNNDDISLFELILDYVDGIGYAPLGSSKLRVYNTSGEEQFSYEDPNGYPFGSAAYNDGMFIVSESRGSSNDYLYYGAIDSNGVKKLDFKYDFILPFRGPYTIARRKDAISKDDLILVDKVGNEYTGDAANILDKDHIARTDGKNKYGSHFIFDSGCIMYKEAVTINGTTKFAYGVRNLRPKRNAEENKKNIIFEAKIVTGATLYPADFRHTFFMYKLGNTDSKNEQIVYRLK